MESESGFGRGIPDWLLVFSAFWVIALLALVAFAASLLVVFPGLLDRANATLSSEFPVSLGVGFAVFVSIPVGLVMIMFTLIGIPIALFGFAVYAAVLGLAFIAICHFGGLKVRTWLNRSVEALSLRHRIGWTFVGIVIFVLIGSVPLIGGFLQTLGIVAGFGALAMTMWRDRAAV